MSATVVASPYVHQAYPKMLYCAGQTPIIVKDQAAHVALGPGWGEVPQGTIAAPATIVGSVPAGLAPSSTAVDLELATLRAENARLKLLQTAVPTAQPAPVAAPVAPVDDATAAEMTALYATPVSTLISKLKGSSLPVLQKLELYEKANPRPEGPRKSLLDAVAIALKGLI